MLGSGWGTPCCEAAKLWGQVMWWFDCLICRLVIEAGVNSIQVIVGIGPE